MLQRKDKSLKRSKSESLLAGSFLLLSYLDLLACNGFDESVLSLSSSSTDSGPSSDDDSEPNSDTPTSMRTADGSEVGSEEGIEGSVSDEASTTSDSEPSSDERLAELLEKQPVKVHPLESPTAQDPKLVKLGQALFFDPILSGKKDIGCATCHHPSYGLSDGLSLTLGTGATGLGPQRADGEHPPFLARHAQQLSNIGQAEFTSMFWDGRVQTLLDGSLETPAKKKMLAGVSGPLAAQAMFSVLDRREMRGSRDSRRVLGEENELANFADDDYLGIWAAIMDRLLAIEGYRQLFSDAFPRKNLIDLTFANAANAIAAFETEGFSLESSRWDQYLRGDIQALSEAEKEGAIIFYGDAGCGKCHAGPLLTDHRFHNTAIPQFGPGQADTPNFDYGRQRSSASVVDRFAFRTPSLRNVALSPPYMHNGAFPTLIAVMLHYKSPTNTVDRFDPENLHPDLQSTIQNDPAHIKDLLSTISSDLNLFGSLAEITSVASFMEALTDPKAEKLGDLRPDSVPSGLDVP